MPAPTLHPAEAGARIRGLRGHPYVDPLRGSASPGAVLRGLRPDEDPSVFWGAWFGGGLLVGVQPVLRVDLPEASDAFALLDAHPGLAASVTGVSGGWAACLGYGSGHTSLAYYDAWLRWRPDAGWSFGALGLVGREAATAAVRNRWQALLDQLETTSPRAVPRSAPTGAVFRTHISAAATRDDYLAAVEEVIARISRGEFYQVNLCTRLHAAAEQAGGSPAAVAARFAELVERLEPAYAALVAGPAPAARESGRTAVLSCSPELFLRIRGTRVQTSPIKGTAPRTAGDAGAAQLRASAKDAAENIMITDLMRNDLSRVCVPGSVRVEGLLDVEAHPGVWHLVSTVQGDLVPGTTIGELLGATFPPGSVTGAPKSAALRAIAELEPEARGVYTGAIGLVTPDAGAELNVAIRTFELGPVELGPVDPERLELGVGSGLTIDSVPIREWEECLHKAAPLVAAYGGVLDPALSVESPAPSAALRAGGIFESVLVVAGQPRRLAAHLARLDRSCRELYHVPPPSDLATEVAARLAAPPPGVRAVLRVALRPTGGGVRVEVTIDALGPRRPHHTLAAAVRPDQPWRHKWRERSALAEAESATAPALPYFVAPARDGGGGGVAETSRGNLFVLGVDGWWRTPPLDDAVLPGVTRRAVLDRLDDLAVPVRIERIPPSELLRTAAGAFWTSSLSGAVPVSNVDGHPVPSAAGLTDELNRLLRVD